MFTILAGALLPAQFATNGALAAELHTLTLTGAVSYLVGSVFLAVLIGVRRLRPAWTDAREAPRWAWLGGVVGSAYVVGSVFLTQVLGAALATTLVIASQIVRPGPPEVSLEVARLVHPGAIAVAFPEAGQPAPQVGRPAPGTDEQAPPLAA